jgi:kinesin family protein C2/C3
MLQIKVMPQFFLKTARLYPILHLCEHGESNAKLDLSIFQLRDLESKTKVQETNTTLDSVIATPREAKLPPFSREEAMSEKEKRILRSSNSLNKQQPLSENSSVPEPI